MTNDQAPPDDPRPAGPAGAADPPPAPVGVGEVAPSLAAAVREAPASVSAMVVARPLLIGFVGSAPARAALAWAERVARGNHGCLTLVLVLNQPWFASVRPALSIAPTVVDLEQAAIEALRAAVAALGDEVSVTLCVVPGPVGIALAREALNPHYDAIEIGRGRRRWRPWPGSVAAVAQFGGALPALPRPGARDRRPRRSRSVWQACPSTPAGERRVLSDPSENPTCLNPTDGRPPDQLRRRLPRLRGSDWASRQTVL